MGALADILNGVGANEAEYAREVRTDELAGQARTTRLQGSHDAATDVGLLRALGHDPEVWRFAGPPAVYKKLDDEGLESFTTYRYKLEAVTSTVKDLLGRIKSHSLTRTPGKPAGGAFTFQSSDLQLGKSDNGGTTDTVDGYLVSVGRAVEKLREAKTRRSIGTAHLIFAGDCIEGNQSQGGRNMWRTDLTVTEQTRVFRHLLYKTIEAFAGEADTLLVDVVNGNHDEVQRFQTTRPDDGHATEAAIAVREGLLLNPDAFGHVQVRVPPIDQGYMTVPVGDTVFTIAHGHQWRRNQAMAWWSGQAFYEQNPGGAHILAHGHFHEFEVQRAGGRMRICSPTYDQGSNYYRELTGAFSPPGGLTYVTEAGTFSDLSIV